MNTCNLLNDNIKLALKSSKNYEEFQNKCFLRNNNQETEKILSEYLRNSLEYVTRKDLDPSMIFY